jgi:glycerol-3-phosphate dehydrogenase
MKKLSDTEVLIIGGGITGTCIARELCRYKVKIALVEKEVSIGFGITKGSQHILHSGFILPPGSLRAKLTVAGNSLLKQISKELQVGINNTGDIYIAKNDDEVRILESLKKRGEENGVEDLQLIDRDTILHMEPNITKEAIAGIYDPSAAMLAPDLTMAIGDNIKENNVEIFTETKVESISRKEEDYPFLVKTNRGDINAQFIVNAAGMFADDISAMVRVNSFNIIPGRRQTYILDKRLYGLINSIIHGTPKPGKRQVVQPTVDESILLGGIIEDGKQKSTPLATTQEGFQIILKAAQGLIPSISSENIIGGFAALVTLHDCGTDYIIESPKEVPKFINLVIVAPSMGASPAIAKMVVSMLGDQGLSLIENSYFNPFREKIPVFHKLSFDQKNDLISYDRRYGHVVCRCETVTEGEIVQAIQKGATTTDEAKFRTRAGMGRCQGGFCLPRVIEILSRELNVSRTEITKFGPGSNILKFKIKETLNS